MTVQFHDYAPTLDLDQAGDVVTPARQHEFASRMDG